MKKIKRNHLLLSGVILLALAYTIGIAIAQDNQTDLVEDIKPYDGSIGPGSALYGLKISIENLRESFTFNDR
ncbi:MAG: hypothetical protein O8C60_04370, partial [Candidatus Methanoperedens sp.]|nr:hypothetical protein [Candidatus Methanoperedens sp.]